MEELDKVFAYSLSGNAKCREGEVTIWLRSGVDGAILVLGYGQEVWGWWMAGQMDRNGRRGSGG